MKAIPIHIEKFKIRYLFYILGFILIYPHVYIGAALSLYIDGDPTEFLKHFGISIAIVVCFYLYFARSSGSLFLDPVKGKLFFTRSLIPGLSLKRVPVDRITDLSLQILKHNVIGDFYSEYWILIRIEPDKAEFAKVFHDRSEAYTAIRKISDLTKVPFREETVQGQAHSRGWLNRF